MEFLNLASGDNENNLQLSVVSENNEENTKCFTNDLIDDAENVITQVKDPNDDIAPEMFIEHENNLKDRIAQCRSVIEALKQELNEEKCRIENVCRLTPHCLEHDLEYTANCGHPSSANDLMEDFTFSSTIYSVSVDSKLNCDKSLIEYEKQLQKYQNTLNMAQMEKKNAIRKQMLSKAYKLKLLEVENQCNIELLRVKQSLQSLEPLQQIAGKWKSNTDDLNDNNSFDLLPRYPDFYSKCSSDITSYTKELGINTVLDKSEKCAKNELPSDA